MDLQRTGALIAAARHEKNMTQRELAEKLHVTDRAVSKWERGLSFPDVSLLEPLCAELGLTLTELLGSEESEQTPEKPLHEIVQFCATALRDKSTKLKLLGAVVCVLLAVLGTLWLRSVWNDPYRPAMHNTLEQVELTREESALLRAMNENLVKYRYAMTEDVQKLRAYYEIWTEDGLYESGVLWSVDRSEYDFPYRGEFYISLLRGNQLCWMQEYTTIIFDILPPENIEMKLGFPYVYDGEKRVEGDSVLMYAFCAKPVDWIRTSEMSDYRTACRSLKRGDAPPVAAGGYTITVWLTAE